jgi:cell division protein FtsW
MKQKVFHTYIHFDPIFLTCLLLIIFVGLFTLQTASIARSNLLYETSYWFFFRQLFIGVIPGFIIFYVLQIIPYTYIKKFSSIFFVFSILLNILVIVPGIGITQKGASRWLDIGFISIQPSEFLKLALVMCFAMFLTNIGRKINKFSSLLWIMVIIGTPAIIVGVVQSNLSTAVLMVSISGAMLFVTKIRWKWILLLLLISLILATFAITSTSYRRSRVQTFVSTYFANEHQDALGSDYQVRQNLIAVGSGGVFGVGVGKSRQKFNYIPEATSDSIFAVYAEEFGFLGVSAFLILTSVFIFRTLSLAKRIKDEYGQFVIIGVVSWFVLQLFINIGATLTVIPLTGVPLPFVSYGSSSLIVMFMAFGIVANIIRNAPKSKL